jgi:hypothetical protein
MELNETLALSLKVLADWRVLLITVAILLSWAALRYAGSVYRRAGPRRRVPKASPTKNRPAARSAAPKEPEEE